MSRRPIRWVAALAAAVLLAACASSPAPPRPAPTRPPTLPPPSPTARKVLLILEENRTYDQVIGTPAAPYLTSLATTYGSAERMDAGYPTRCPSLAAYIILTSGADHGICDDDDPADHRLDVPNVFAQVRAAGLGWRTYAEHAPGNCALTNSTDGVFLVRHVPIAYYTGERDACARDDVPLGTPEAGTLRDDVVAGTLPAYGFVVPDACHDMHGARACSGDPVAAGDAWLAQWLPIVLAGPDYRAGRLVVIVTWDEGGASSNHIPTVIVSPTTSHIVSTTPYDHCATLRTTEDLLGLPPLGCAADARSMVADFHL